MIYVDVYVLKDSEGGYYKLLVKTGEDVPKEFKPKPIANSKPKNKPKPSAKNQRSDEFRGFESSDIIKGIEDKGYFLIKDWEIKITERVEKK